MSLNWNVGEIEGYKDLCWVPSGETLIDEDTGEEKESRYLSWQTNALIRASMSVGMASITEKNWREFYLRMKLDQTSMVHREAHIGQGDKLTAQDVFNHIGLHTNASSQTRAQFLKKLYKYEEEVHYRVFAEIEKGEEDEQK